MRLAPAAWVFRAFLCRIATQQYASLRRPAVSGGASGAIAVGLLRAFQVFLERPEPHLRVGEEAAEVLREPSVCRCLELQDFNPDAPGVQALFCAFVLGLGLLPLLDLLAVVRRCWARALLALERRVSLWLAGAGLLCSTAPSRSRIA